MSRMIHHFLSLPRMRLFLAAFFVVSLMVFLHFREVLIEVYEVGSRAPRYVVAQVSFAFPDPDATLMLRQEALRDLGKIYQIPETELAHAKHRVETELLQHPHWRDKADFTFEEAYKVLDQAIFFLSTVRITDARTLKKQQEFTSHQQWYLLSSKEGKFPSDFWEQVEEKLPQGDATNFVISQLKHDSWSLTSDIDAQKALQEEVELSIPERYTQVTAGSRLIDQGEKITPKHIAMLKAMKAELNRSRNLWSLQTIGGSLFFSLLITICAALYLYHRQRAIIRSNRDLSVYITIILITLLLAKGGEWLLLHTTTQWSDVIRYPLIIPFAAILICLLLNEELAIFTSAYLTTFLGITLATNATAFLTLNLLTGTVAAINTNHLRKRKEIFVILARVWLVAAALVFSFNLASGTLLTYTTPIDLAATAINLFVISLFIIGLTPLLESFFNLMTNMTLMEFMDPSNPLLKRLSIEAPGTYQHSIAIGFIAEYAANAINANGLFCRVTTLYHDIGKLNTPHYYTENQLVMGGNQFDIHQLLTPTESAYIIKAHVQEGVELARQYKLPQSFIDIIYQHHGTTLIKYFYAKRLAEVGGNPNDVDENAFRYPGPKPQTKEAAIIMLSDSIEAASRTLEDNSEESIRNLINRITNDKISDNQLDECPLTFQELHKIKEKLLEILKATHHLRIKYPT